MIDFTGTVHLCQEFDFLEKSMKVCHIANLHKNTLAESHKYKMKHILLEIKSLKLNLIKNKACQSVISRIQHW
jgi:hypothetical protein